jgi:hypothetical protein
MFLRKIFQEFPFLQTEAEPPPPDSVHEPPRTWSLDWRWLEAAEDVS